MEFGCKAMQFAEEVKAPEASFSEFFSFLTSKSGQLWPYLYTNSYRTNNPLRRKEVLFCKKITYANEDFFIGVILSDSLKKTAFNREGNTVKEVELNANDEINLVVIKLCNYKSLYASYRGAISIDTFFRDLWLDYKQFVIKKRDSNCPQKEKDPKWEDYSFKNKARYSHLISQDNFQNALQTLQNVQELAFSVSGFNPQTCTLGNSVSDNIKSSHQIIRFNANTRLTTKLTELFLNAYNVSKRILKNRTKNIGYVKGIDSCGNERTVNFDEILDDLFKTQDIPIKSNTLNLDKIEEYPPIKEMLDAASNKGYSILQ